MLRILFHLSYMICFSLTLSSQNKAVVKLTLEQVMDLAKQQSIATQQANAQKRTAQWKYQNFLAKYKPQLTLNGTLPNFNRTFQEVIQPDGSIEFQSVTNNNSSINFSLNQSIALTGANIYVNSRLQRFDDFNRDFTLYNGLPIGIGIEQPLFAFNTLKWDKKIEPLYLQESEQSYVESIEQIGLIACNRFFDFLLAQVNLQIAQVNLSNNDTLYKIALERFDLGKISRNDLLRMRLEVLKSKKSVAGALQNLEIVDLQLKSYIAFREVTQIELVLPKHIPEFDIDKKQALEQALSNRSAAIGFKRRAIEAAMEIDKAKKTTGFQASIFAAFGLSNSAKNIEAIYKNPQDRETIELGFNLPILDWGRAKSQKEIARINGELITYEIEQDRIVFEEEIYTLITLFDKLKEQLTLSEETDRIAAERYEIAKNRFLIGNLSITDLTIAAQEKDQAKRDYIYALRGFWNTIFEIRTKTLYDFQHHKKL